MNIPLEPPVGHSVVMGKRICRRPGDISETTERRWVYGSFMVSWEDLCRTAEKNNTPIFEIGCQIYPKDMREEYKKTLEKAGRYEKEHRDDHYDPMG